MLALVSKAKCGIICGTINHVVLLKRIKKGHLAVYFDLKSDFSKYQAN